MLEEINAVIEEIYRARNTVKLNSRHGSEIRREMDGNGKVGD